jgi:phage recombination protein Bet
MSNALATTNGIVPAAIDFSNQQLEMIQHSVMPGANALEFDLFLNLCKAKRLDPLTKQIYAVKVGGKWQTFASIDGLRVIAERSGNYGGQTEPYWCGPDGEWKEVWLSDDPPSAAKVGVWKRGYLHPTWGVATFKSYGKGKGNNWVSMPDVMLLKCAEALALRKAFPDDLSALYVREEFAEDAPRSAAPTPLNERPAAIAEVVDENTGEISIEQTPLDAKAALGMNIRALRDRLGWSEGDVRDAAERNDLKLNTIDGLQGMVALLAKYVAADEERETSQQATIIDAEVVGEPGNDRWS